MFAQLIAAGGGGSILIGECTWGITPGKDHCINGYYPHLPGTCNNGKAPVGPG